jgi:hypothetical protein
MEKGFKSTPKKKQMKRDCLVNEFPPDFSSTNYVKNKRNNYLDTFV